MSHLFVKSLISLICPWLAMVRALQWLGGERIARRGPIRLVILGVAAIGILTAPIHGFSVGGWVRGIEANFSIPLAALLATAVWENEFGKILLRPAEKRMAWIFGVVAGLLLYPMALGLGNFDPYEWGWGASPLFVASGIATVVLIWTGNRFSIVLLLTILAYHLRLLESNNYWDYLVDPIYFVAAIVTLAARAIPRGSRTSESKT